jgi:UDP-N-acetylglucosamine transferase subunit ALG13
MAGDGEKIQKSEIRGSNNMIFITVGTEKFPFDRLLKTVDEGVKSGMIKDKVFAQTGSSLYVPESFPHEKYLDFLTQSKHIREADIVVSHAGEGSIILCLGMGKLPIVFPRDSAFKEHVDNHQFEMARKMGDAKRIITAYTGEELIDRITNYKSYAAAIETIDCKRCQQTLVKYLKRICLQDTRG